MTTARTHIKSALRKIQVLGAGQTLSNEDAQVGLEILNDMLDGWSVEGNLVKAETRESFPLTTGQASYSISIGGDFNTAPPQEIIAAFVRQSNIDDPITVIDAATYAAISDKSTPGIPRFLYYDDNGTLFLHPVPVADYTLHLYSHKALSRYTSLDTDVTLAVGAKRAIDQNLAVELAQEFDREPSMQLLRGALKAKNALKASTTRHEYNDRTTDLCGNSPYNIYRGY